MKTPSPTNIHTTIWSAWHYACILTKVLEKPHAPTPYTWSSHGGTKTWYKLAGYENTNLPGQLSQWILRDWASNVAYGHLKPRWCHKSSKVNVIHGCSRHVGQRWGTIATDTSLHTGNKPVWPGYQQPLMRNLKPNCLYCRAQGKAPDVWKHTNRAVGSHQRALQAKPMGMYTKHTNTNALWSVCYNYK